MLSKQLPSRLVESADYEDGSDSSLRSALDLAWPVQALVRVFVRHLGEPWLNGKITGQGVKVGPHQLPHLDRLVRQAAELIGVEPPHLFVVRSSALEPVLLGVGDQNTLALSSALLEESRDEELLYLLGREMGHIKSQHVVYLTLLRWLKDTLNSTVRQLALPALAGLYSWQRAATFSADRAGLIASQDLTVSCRALVRLVLGPNELFRQIDVERYVREGLHDILSHPLKSAPELLETAPYLPRRLARLYDFKASPAYAELFPFDA